MMNKIGTNVGTNFWRRPSCLYFLLLLVFPLLTSAQAPTDFKGLVDVILGIIDVLIVLIFVLTFIVFLWGITKAWILNPGDERARESGKSIAVAGIVAFLFMSAVWALVAIIRLSLFGG